MDSLTDGTARLLRYDDRRRQLDLLCVMGATAVKAKIHYTSFHVQVHN